MKHAHAMCSAMSHALRNAWHGIGQQPGMAVSNLYRTVPYHTAPHHLLELLNDAKPSYRTTPYRTVPHRTAGFMFWIALGVAAMASICFTFMFHRRFFTRIPVGTLFGCSFLVQFSGTVLWWRRARGQRGGKRDRAGAGNGAAAGRRQGASRRQLQQPCSV